MSFLIWYVELIIHKMLLKPMNVTPPPPPQKKTKLKFCVKVVLLETSNIATVARSKSHKSTIQVNTLTWRNFRHVSGYYVIWVRTWRKCRQALYNTSVCSNNVGIDHKGKALVWISREYSTIVWVFITWTESQRHLTSFNIIISSTSIVF